MDDRVPVPPELADYPDIGPPEELPEGFKVIKMIPGIQARAPKIKWGKFFRETLDDGSPNPDLMPLEWRAERYRKVAEAMNHAADVMQQRVFELIEVAKSQEAQIEQWAQRYESQSQVHHQLVERLNAEKHSRVDEIMALKRELHALKKQQRQQEASDG